jgi:serine protease Do
MFSNENNNEKREFPGMEYDPSPESVNNEPAVTDESHIETVNDEPVSIDATHNAPAFNEPESNYTLYTEPVINEQAYNASPVYSEPVYSEPVYSAPSYSEPVHAAPAYSEPVQTKPAYDGEPAHNLPHEVPQNMYSPGICVNHPYRRQYRSTGSPAAPPLCARRSKLGGFIRAVCLVLVCSLFSATATYFVMDYRFNKGDFTINRQVILGGGKESVPDSSLTAPVATLTDGMSASDIYDMALTQVVGINTESPGFFGSQGTVTPVSGSGFIISNDGYILTNYHVIELAHANNLPISVVLNDSLTYKATVVGFDSDSDVAVIKIDATGLNPAFIGNSDDIRVGQRIYAVGNPFGDFVYTMTDGIVSALDRVVSLERKTINAFQFSAAVNSGNSGGPIYNTSGEVVGIVTAKVVRGNVEGIGFAIPINDAIEIASELIERGYLSGRPLLGVTVQTVLPSHAEYYGWVVGVYVRSVTEDSAADKAGIAAGDIITAISGEDVDSLNALRLALRNHKAGETAEISVWRNGEDIELSITFDEDLSAGQPVRAALPEPESPDPFENIP